MGENEVTWEKQDEKALALIDLGYQVGLVFFDTRQDRALPKEVRLLGKDMMQNQKEMLTDWQPDSSPPISTTHLRGFNLGRLQRQWSRERTGKKHKSDLSHLVYNVENKDKLETAGFSFRRSQDLLATVDRVRASLRYEELVDDGDPNPVQSIAEEFFKGEATRARNVISAARREGLLSKATPGRPGGHATNKCREIAASMRRHPSRGG